MKDEVLMARLRRERRTAERRKQVRGVPPSPHKAGCRWCGKPVAPGPTGRKRTWHAECLSAYFIATKSSAQRNACLSRDGGRCCICGLQCEQPKPGSTFYPDDGFGPYRLPPPFYGQEAEYPFSVVHWVTLRKWHADHTFPLWSVDRDLPWERLIWYWSINNLQSLCDECHKTKTNREAKQRAKEARIRAKAGNPDPKPMKIKDLPF